MVGTGGVEKSRRIKFSHGKWSTRGTKTAKSVLPYVQVPGELVRIFFVHYCCCGSHFPEGHLGITEECTNLEFSYTYGRFLLDFSIPRIPTILGCESHSQAGLASLKQKNFQWKSFTEKNVHLPFVGSCQTSNCVIHLIVTVNCQLG